MQIRIKEVKTLSDDWYVLKKTTFDFCRRDGRWQTMSRETYDRGHGAVILLYNLAQRTVILVRQFRFPAYGHGGTHDGYLLEAPAGLLDAATPEQRIRAEVEEETGHRVHHVRRVFEAFMSPGSVTERLYFFVAEYAPDSRVSGGGGVEQEGEDIEVVELDIDTALAMVADGRIEDGKTIMLLQHAALVLFRDRSGAPPGGGML